MNLVRTAVAAGLVLLLGGGYFASQYAYFLGNPVEYKNAIDTPTIKWFALALFLMIIILPFVKNKEEAS